MQIYNFAGITTHSLGHANRSLLVAVGIKRKSLKKKHLFVWLHCHNDDYNNDDDDDDEVDNDDYDD